MSVWARTLSVFFFIQGGFRGPSKQSAAEKMRYLRRLRSFIPASATTPYPTAETLTSRKNVRRAPCLLRELLR